MQWFGLLEEIICLVSMFQSANKSDWDAGFILAGIRANLKKILLFELRNHSSSQSSEIIHSQWTKVWSENSVCIRVMINLGTTSAAVSAHRLAHASVCFSSVNLLSRWVRVQCKKHLHILHQWVLWCTRCSFRACSAESAFLFLSRRFCYLWVDYWLLNLKLATY